MQQYQQANFLHFIFYNKTNRLYGIATLGISITIWFVFKQFYPHPNIIYDSYFYIRAAVSNADVGSWPIGYSKFIRWAGLISHSATWLLTLQHCMLIIAFLFFFFTVRFFFIPGRTVTLLLFLCFILNPIFPYMSNLILSDTLFTTFSLLWIAQLLWIIFRPRPYMIVTQALLLLIVFTIRYNALCYPVATVLAFLLSRQRLRWMLAGIALPAIVLGGFIWHTTHQMEVQFKVRQFSSFGNWKAACNALYVYEHVYRQHPEPVPVRFQALDKRVRQYFDGPHYQVDILTNDPTWGSFYLYILPSPLIQYMLSIYGQDPFNQNFKNIASIGPLYGAYGAYLTRKYPLAFIQYFIWPNLQRYFNPPQEVLVDDVNPFTLRYDDLGTPAIGWFALTTLRVPDAYIAFRTELFSFYPVGSTIIHVFFLLIAISFCWLKAWRLLTRQHNYALLALAIFWCCNFAFNILSSPVVLRYQLFITLFEATYAVLLLEIIYRQAKQSPPSPVA